MILLISLLTVIVSFFSWNINRWLFLENKIGLFAYIVFSNIWGFTFFISTVASILLIILKIVVFSCPDDCVEIINLDFLVGR